jgi:N-acetylmuramate 1-kinase
MPASRDAAIRAFLDAAGRPGAPFAMLAGDASFRRYLRLPGGAVVMDAPPEQGEDVRPFAAVAGHLQSMGLHAPRVLAADERAGLLLLDDFGDATFERALAAGAAEEPLYDAAVDVLVALHRHPSPAWAPPYDRARLDEELALFTDWYLPAVRGRPTPAGERADFLRRWREPLAVACAVRTVLVLRDYHTRNLMWLPTERGLRRVGLLDFQDAVAGPLTYDLASLAGDAYRDVSPALAERMVGRYLAAAPAVDEDAFRRSLALISVHRWIKVIGIFTRLARRDGKVGYMAHIPLLWRRLDGALARPELAAVRDWVDGALPGGVRPVPGAGGGRR